MLRVSLLALICATLAGSALADPIVGETRWYCDFPELHQDGPTIYGFLPESGRVIQELASCTNYFPIMGPTIITIPTPEYVGGPAPMSDVFFSVTLDHLAPADPYMWAIRVSYSGGDTLAVDEFAYVSDAMLRVEAVAIRTEDPLADIEDPQVSVDKSMLQNTPNPFQSSTRLDYQIDETSAAKPVSIQVLDATGRALRTLFDGYQSPGTHVITWDGRDDSGGPVANGVYFLQLRNGSNTMQRRVTVVR